MQYYHELPSVAPVFFYKNCLELFMNIPINIQDVCTGKDTNNDGNGDSPCDDCLEYDENI